MLIPVLVLLAAACSSSFGGDGAASSLVLVNRTDHALLYVAFNLEEAALVDPNPFIDPADAPERLVPAGTERTLDLPDYTGGGVVLFLYEIPAQDRAGPVPLSRTLQFTAAELARSRGRMVVEDA